MVTDGYYPWTVQDAAARVKRLTLTTETNDVDTNNKL